MRVRVGRSYAPSTFLKLNHPNLPPSHPKAIGRKEYTKLRRIFVQIQGARQALSPLANCRATRKLDDKDKQVGIFFDRNRLSPTDS
uniref:Uncharacterized protein n=1 Tax=Candidatus Kentrum sp. FM TaxID=2126340 RepID=A0A450SFM8_9GAMM|nr:MAG: hypothetical protein BECKFM1743C_GA0114222_101001 [Candidatus Kentron sp. FM]